MYDMKTLDPLTFEADRHTDLWIASRVMEWPVVQEWQPFKDYLEFGGIIIDDRPQIFRFGMIPDAWMPSTNIADSAVVLRKMIEKGWVYSIHGYPGEKGNMVVFTKAKQEFSATAKTESLAICRAAGLAVIGEK